MIIRNGNLRATLLGSAGTAALASLIAGGAHAAETRITPDAPIVIGTAEGHAVVNAAPMNTGTVNATIANATTASTASGTDSAVSTTVDSNAMRASATGNDFTNSVDLSVVPPQEALGTGDGAASLAVSINAGAISSIAAGNAIGAQHETSHSARWTSRTTASRPPLPGTGAARCFRAPSCRRTHRIRLAPPRWW